MTKMMSGLIHGETINSQRHTLAKIRNFQHVLLSIV